MHEVTIISLINNTYDFDYPRVTINGVSLVTWSNQAEIETGWSITPEGIWSKYDIGGDYDGLLLASDDVDLPYDGGYFDQDLWTNATNPETNWRTH